MLAITAAGLRGDGTTHETLSMSSRPELVISSLDAERLEALLSSLSDQTFPGKAALEAELARADIVEPEQMPPTVVSMNSTVRFRVAESHEEFTLRLVYPKDSTGSQQTISILAPVGSALLGLAQGDEIDWPNPSGGLLRVRIEEVIDQPERRGEYHR